MLNDILDLPFSEKVDNLVALFGHIQEEVKRMDKNLFERWKAGGFIVSNNVVSMYPCIEEVAEILGDESFDNEDEM